MLNLNALTFTAAPKLWRSIIDAGLFVWMQHGLRVCLSYILHSSFTIELNIETLKDNNYIRVFARKQMLNALSDWGPPTYLFINKVASSDFYYSNPASENL